MSARPGRNDPCPCGSGTKYKKCCANAPGASASSATPSAPPDRASMLHRLDRDLVERMLEFGDRFEDWVPEDDFPVRLSEVPEAAMLLRPWAVYEYAPGDVTVRERFLRARRFELRASEIAWLEAQGRSWLTAWEVLCVTAWSEMARTVITRRCLRRRRPSRRRWPARAAPREGASCVAPGTPLVVGACLAPNARPRLSFSPLVWDRRVSS